MTVSSEISFETQIRELLDGWTNAVRSKNLDAITACYASDVMVFDLLPPMRYQGFNDYVELWKECFSNFESPVGFDIQDLKIAATNEVAFCHFLSHLSGKSKYNTSVSSWFRMTLGCCKSNGKWLIVHEHSSVPVNMMTGEACMDLTPDSQCTYR